MVDKKDYLGAAYDSLKAWVSGTYKTNFNSRNVEFSAENPLSFFDIPFGLRTEEPVYQDMFQEADGGVFYDIGAYQGLYTCLMAPEFEQVFSFEPDHDNYEMLIDNIELNELENVEDRSLALSNKNGSAFLKKKSRPDSESRLSVEGNVEVDTVTVDDMISDNSLPEPNIVKIDTEGHEKEVLEGMRETMSESQPIVYCEVHQNDQGGIKTILQDYYDSIEVLIQRWEDNLFIKAY